MSGRGIILSYFFEVCYEVMDGGDMPGFPDAAQIANLALIEELYGRYQADPESVDPSWGYFFKGIDFGSYLAQRGTEPKGDSSSLRISNLIQAYRRYGHLLARFNPVETKERDAPELNLELLGFFESELPQVFPTLGFCGKPEAPLSEIIEALQGIYSSRIGFEYMDLSHPDLEKWIQGKIEPQIAIEPSIEEKHLLLEYLNKSEILETFINTKYTGQTRFSLEGAETMIPVIAELIEQGAVLGIEKLLIGMAHRGRLNVLANILNKPYASIFQEFEDDTTLSYTGNDDVKYHMGFSGTIETRIGKKVGVEIAANPSHLESVDPVVLGQTFAQQVNTKDEEKKKIGALLIHGDASIAGQGVVYETLQLMKLPAYDVGGTLHLVVNNQIGYTTLPDEGRSSLYCTDIAKAFGAPVFHINAEDPESCLFAAKLAIEIRQKFGCDVFLDLVCYRKYGHNEGDEPAFTQPMEYQIIRGKKPIRQLYTEQLQASGQLEQKLAETLDLQFKETLKTALQSLQGQPQKEKQKNLPIEASLLEPFDSKIDAKRVATVLQKYSSIPPQFHIHPKLQKWLQDRASIGSSDPKVPSVDWATGECLAFGSLLLQGVPIRFAGQDVRRGTFSQRHMVWKDFETGQSYCPLCKMSPDQGRFDIINSPLSEFACLGFEYGYTWSSPQTLVLWEAQYGDFFNGAQIIIDQYIVSGEQKWNCPSGITLLLPHAYEGAGPEHSSARLERFLQMGAHSNIQVVYPTTPAQYFHLLRRQALRKMKKPLIVYTPKGLLRAPACKSSVKEITEGRFEEILDDPTPPNSCKRLLFCSGKVFYDLMDGREKKKAAHTAIIRIEQLYPLSLEKLKKIIDKYKGFTECCWVQEEPANMGAWNFVGPYLQHLLPSGVSLRYVGRPESPTTATGSHKKHKQEQQVLIDEAL